MDTMIPDQQQSGSVDFSKQNLGAIQYALEQVGIGIHFVSYDGHLTYVNDAACKMLGYSRDEMLSMSVPDIDPNFPKGDFAQATEGLRQQPSRFETTQLTKDGATIHVEVVLHYVYENSVEDGHFVAFMISLDERRAAEAERQKLQGQLLQSQKMESIGHLTGGIAHDFNNMLAAMIGNAELTRYKLNQDSNIQSDVPRMRGYIDAIISAGQRAKELIAQMLIFSRRTPNSNVETPAVLLAPVIKEVSNLLRSSLPTTIELQNVIYDKQLHACIAPVQLHQIVLNLAINARDAIDGYGKINISLKRHSGKCDCSSCYQSVDGDFVALTVNDTGAGISRENLPHIFEPFFTTKEVGKGSGMGLSVVHGIVHSIGGHISLHSKTGEGTTMTILLPHAEDTNLVKSDLAPFNIASTKLHEKRIMVVDDELTLTEMLKELLSMYGAKVFTYSNGRDALREFAAAPHDFDLVITDETMPGITGLDLSRQVLSIRPELPIIICTGYSEAVDAVIAKENGISGFMYKPADSEELISMAVSVLP